MNKNYWAQIVVNGIYSMTEVVVWIGYIMAVILELVVFVDVFGRYIFNHPLRGTLELVEQSMTVIAGFAIMYAAVKKGHVVIDILTVRFSIQAQRVMQSIFSFVGFGTWFVVGYQVYLYALDLLEKSQITQVLKLSVAPALLLFAIAAFLCSIILLVQTFYPTTAEKTMEPKE